MHSLKFTSNICVFHSGESVRPLGRERVCFTKKEKRRKNQNGFSLRNTIVSDGPENRRGPSFNRCDYFVRTSQRKFEFKFSPLFFLSIHITHRFYFFFIIIILCLADPINDTFDQRKGRIHRLDNFVVWQNRAEYCPPGFYGELWYYRVLWMAFGFGYNIPQVMSGGPCVARKSKRSCRATAIWMSSNWQPEGAIRIFEIQPQDQRHFVRTKFQISRSFFFQFQHLAVKNNIVAGCTINIPIQQNTALLAQRFGSKKTKNKTKQKNNPQIFGKKNCQFQGALRISFLFPFTIWALTHFWLIYFLSTEKLLYILLNIYFVAISKTKIAKWKQK